MWRSFASRFRNGGAGFLNRRPHLQNSRSPFAPLYIGQEARQGVRRVGRGLGDDRAGDSVLGQPRHEAGLH